MESTVKDEFRMDLQAFYNYWYDRYDQREHLIPVADGGSYPASNCDLLSSEEALIKQAEEERRKMTEIIAGWRLKFRLKTLCGGLVICLNLGVDPPDLIRPQPSAHVQCWLDPSLPAFTKEGLENIGKHLLNQYGFWQPKAKFRLGLDPCLEDLRKLCINLRKSAREERVLFHYNGHGVPKPTPNGELWVFNKNYTQYIPCSILEIHGLLCGSVNSRAAIAVPNESTSNLNASLTPNSSHVNINTMTGASGPVIYVFDCSHAGNLMAALADFVKQAEERQLEIQLQKIRINTGKIRNGPSDSLMTPEIPSNTIGTSSSFPFIQRLFQPSPLSATGLSANTGAFAATEISSTNISDFSPGPSLTSPTFTSTASPAFNSSMVFSPGLDDFPSVPDILVLAATGSHFSLSLHPDMPADVFTSCLTTPIEMSIRWYLLFQNPPLACSMVSLDEALKLPGRLNDRKSPLGELHWILTAVTDTIAWDILVANVNCRLTETNGSELFQRLFRQDILVAALFRNFLLAERIMKSLGGIRDTESFTESHFLNLKNGTNTSFSSPISFPVLPTGISEHPMWETWDLALEFSLTQIPLTSRLGKSTFPTNPFFADQLKSFEIYLIENRRLIQFSLFSSGGEPSSHLFSSNGYFSRTGTNLSLPSNLPIILQILLSPTFRPVALSLLVYYFDLGPWAIHSALFVGIFAYLLKLLASPSPELFPILTWLWFKLLAFDPSIKLDLLKEDSFVYFFKRLKKEPSPPPLSQDLLEASLNNEFPLVESVQLKELLDEAMQPGALFCLYLFVVDHPLASVLVRAKQPDFISILLSNILPNSLQDKSHDTETRPAQPWIAFWSIMLLKEMVTVDHVASLPISSLIVSFNKCYLESFEESTCIAWLLLFKKILTVLMNKPTNATIEEAIIITLIEWIHSKQEDMQQGKFFNYQIDFANKNEKRFQLAFFTECVALYYSVHPLPAIPLNSEGNFTDNTMQRGDDTYQRGSSGSSQENLIEKTAKFSFSSSSKVSCLSEMLWKTLLLLIDFPEPFQLISHLLLSSSEKSSNPSSSASFHQPSSSSSFTEPRFFQFMTFLFDRQFSTLHLFPSTATTSDNNSNQASSFRSSSKNPNSVQQPFFDMLSSKKSSIKKKPEMY